MLWFINLLLGLNHTNGKPNIFVRDQRLMPIRAYEKKVLSLEQTIRLVQKLRYREDEKIHLEFMQLRQVYPVNSLNL